MLMGVFPSLIHTEAAVKCCKYVLELSFKTVVPHLSIEGSCFYFLGEKMQEVHYSRSLTSIVHSSVHDVSFN